MRSSRNTQSPRDPARVLRRALPGVFTSVRLEPFVLTRRNILPQRHCDVTGTAVTLAAAIGQRLQKIEALKRFAIHPHAKKRRSKDRTPGAPSQGIAGQVREQALQRAVSEGESDQPTRRSSADVLPERPALS